MFDVLFTYVTHQLNFNWVKCLNTSIDMYYIIFVALLLICMCFYCPLLKPILSYTHSIYLCFLYKFTIYVLQREFRKRDIFNAFI